MNPLSNKIRNIKDFIKNEIKDLYPENESEAISTIILENSFGISKKDIILSPDTRISESEIVNVIKIVKRLKNHEPVQYITGVTDFLDLKLKVKPPVLIPRPETEELVLWIEKELREKKLTEGNLLDFGSGSGCIALAIKKLLPGLSVCGLDKNHEAIELSKENASNNNIEAEFFERDIFSLTEKDDLIKKDWDVWVSNPPYVRISEKSNIRNNVLTHEPHEALFVNDDEPLIFYEKISELAKKILKPKSLVFFEINEALGMHIKQLLKNKNFSNIEIKKDINDKDRFVKATI